MSRPVLTPCIAHPCVPPLRSLLRRLPVALLAWAGMATAAPTAASLVGAGALLDVPYLAPAGAGLPDFAAVALHARACCFATSVAMADLDGDGGRDLVVGNGMSYDVSVLLSDGEGGWNAPTNLPLWTSEYGYVAVALGDLDGDGDIDIAASGVDATHIQLFIGDGSGGFATGTLLDIGSGAWPRALAIADIDGDGDADLVSANNDSASISVLRGDGAGAFAAAQGFPAGAYPVGLAIADLDGDGDADIATLNAGSRDVALLAGDGSGQFAAPVAHPTGVDAEPYGIALGDANGDGHPDIVVGNGGSDGTPFPPPELPGSVSLFAGNGTGGFAAATSLALGGGDGRAHAVAIGDITGDGHDDIVSANFGSNNLSLLAGSGNGTFAPAVHLAVDGGPVVVLAADLDADGDLDLATANQWGQSATVLLADGTGGFAAAASYAIFPPQVVIEFDAWPWGLAIGDVTGDGLPDLATANTQNDTVSVLPNDGSGGFGSYTWFASGANPGAVAIADIDGDGRNDVVSANRSNDDVAVLRNVTAADSIFADGFDGD